jgi:hypothetical protein
MATIYGQNTAFETIRTRVGANLDALAANMVTNTIVPRFDAVYDTHWENPAIDFNAISYSVSEIVGFVTPGSGVGRIEFLYNIEMRIMTGNDNQPHDEVTFLQLANSVANWFLERLHALGSNLNVKTETGRDIIRVEPNVTFEDTRTIGGRVWLLIYGFETYTQQAAV